MQSEETVLSVPSMADTGHAGDGTGSLNFAGSMAAEVFSNHELEQLCFRRFNPLALLNAANLSAALDGFDCGVLMQAARLWQRISERDDIIPTVKTKREDSVAKRQWVVTKKDDVPDSPEAKDQVAALKSFYDNVRTADALNRHTVGGKPLLARQMMQAVAFLYSAHHIIWKPNAGMPLTLPSGQVVPSLSATFEHVPLEFFEARTGELRFLGLSLGYTGEPLAPNNWMVTTGPGLMRAASVLYYFKRLAMHDLVNFSEDFGQPATLGQTTAAKGSPEGEAMREAVKHLAANYRGVLYGAPENKLEHVWPSGGVNAANIPSDVIIERCERAISSLWLGGDLSTKSRGGQERGVGASLQADAMEDREQADCAMLSETLNAQVDPVVLEWFFGPNAPVLAKVTVVSPVNEDRSLLLNLTQGAVAMGAKVPIQPVMERLNVPVAQDGEAVFTQPATPEKPAPDSAAIAAAVNSDAEMNSRRKFGGVLASKLVGRAQGLFPEAVASDMQPLRDALARVLHSGDAGLIMNADALYRQLPSLAKEIIPATGSSDKLYEILSAALATGLATQTHHSA